MFPFHTIILPILKYGVTFSYLYFLHFYIKTRLPLHHEYMCLYLSYNAIFWYSKGELYYLKYKKELTIQYNKMIQQNIYASLFVKGIKTYYNNCKNNSNITTNNPICIEFIKDGIIIFSTTKENMFVERNESTWKLPEHFDFIIYSAFHSNHKDTPKLVFYHIPTKEEIDTYEISNPNILMAELIIRDKQIKLSFKGADYNYFIVNNIFTASFMYYFFKKYHSHESVGITKEQFDSSSFQIKILDADINQLIVQDNESIKIQKEGLEIQQKYIESVPESPKIEEELDYNIVD